MSRKYTYDVFISYRRQKGAEMAELTKTALTKRGFRGNRIFMDTRSISSGNYIEAIGDALDKSKNIVVVITRGCFENLPADSTWIMEIESALQKGKNIVPMYFDGVSEIKPDDLPSRIRSLSLENAVLYSHPYSDASFDRLASRLPKDSLTLPGWSKWLLGGLAATGLVVGGYAAIDNATGLKPGEVYIVNSETARSYHNSKDCWALKNARHKIKKIPETKAIEQGKRPCKKCYKR